MYKALATKILLTLPFVLFLYLRLDGIVGDMSNSDALRWHRRSEIFSQSILKQEFAQTYQRYHPGVTLMWITSFTEWGIKLYDRAFNLEFKTLENTDGYLVIDGTSKIVLVLVLFVLLLVQVRYISILYDKNVAIFYVFVSAIEPYFIGINRWYHLTSIEVALSFCALLTMLLWSEYGDKKYIYKSGLFFGLAVLTKFSSVFLLPMLALIFIYTIYQKKNLTKSFFIYSALAFTSISTLIFFIVFPAMWVTPLQVIKNMTDAAINSGAGEYLSVVYAERHPYLFYLVVILFKFSPLTLFLLLLALIKVTHRKDKVAFFLILSVIIQLILLSASEQKIERYILACMPAMFLLVAIVLASFPASTQKVAVVVMIVTSVITFRNYHPLYSSYYSGMFGGPLSAYKVGIYDDNGEFFARVAQYLNAKGRDTRVFVPYNVESFSPYFKGKLETQLMTDEGYFVVSKDARRPRATYGINCPIVDQVVINNYLEAVTIFKCIKPDPATLKELEEI